MGLLDDAIREHLDLKRRRGGDPAEIERAERDALGPVRRNRDPGGSGDPEALTDDDYAAADSAYDEPDEGVASDLVDEREPARTGAENLDGDPFAEGDPFADEDPLTDEDPLANEDSVAREQSDAGQERFAEEEPFPARDEGTSAGEDVDEEPKTRVMRATDIPAPSDATTEYDVEEALADERGAGREGGDEEDEDVLEETPEFLQDTPDHDRLWFEQRPPRDFDFDG